MGVSGVIPGRYAKQEKGFILFIPRDVGRKHAAQLGAKAKFSVLYSFFRNRNLRSRSAADDASSIASEYKD